MRAQLPVGALPGAPTAAGKALLAWRDAWCEVVLEQPLRSYTDRTATGRQWLHRELDRTRARGFAVEDREFQADTRSGAVPVFGGDEAVAALGVVAPADRLPSDRQREIAEIAGRCAAGLSVDLVA